MPYRLKVVTVVVVAMAGVVVSLGAQGKGKSDPARPAEATFDCVDPDPTRGLCASDPLVAELSGGGLYEMEIRDAADAMVLNFGDQTPDNSPDPSDCSLAMGTCLWNWLANPRSGDFLEFALGTNILDPAGSSELAGGLLAMPTNTVHKVRLNMTITVPETAPGFWKFNFNASNPATAGGDNADVERLDACHWVFSAEEARAALAILVDPPKGKSYLHREGTHAMPFQLTFTVPSLCAASN